MIIRQNARKAINFNSEGYFFVAYSPFLIQFKRDTAIHQQLYTTMTPLDKLRHVGFWHSMKLLLKTYPVMFVNNNIVPLN